MKKAIFILAVLLAFSILPFDAHAHPGKTDSNGGHWDYSTGEYHYHHGYEAHSHYDRNKDGIVDCPYDFDDQTGVNSGTASSGSGLSRDYSYYEYIPRETVTVYKDREVIKEVPVTPTWVKWTITFLGCLIVILFLINKQIKSDAAYWENQFHEGIAFEKKNAEINLAEQQTAYNSKLALCEEQLKEANARHEAQINSIKSHFAQKQEIAEIALQYDINRIESTLSHTLGEDYLYILSGSPYGDSIDSQGYPQSYDQTQYVWGQKYTFLISSHSQLSEPIKYHSTSCRYGHTQVNAYRLRNSKRYTPCKHCSPELPDMRWVDRFNELKRFREKYKKSD